MRNEELKAVSGLYSLKRLSFSKHFLCIGFTTDSLFLQDIQYHKPAI